MRASTCLGSVGLCAAAVFCLGACDGEELAVSDDPAAVSYKVIAQGSGTGRADGEQYRLVESQALLDNLFYSVGQQAGALPPVVDFVHEAAYFATLGASPTTGYGIAVEGLRRSSAGAPQDALEVDIKVFKPGPRCFNATVVTAPYVIITFPREALNRGVINLNVNEQITNCGG